MSAPFESRATRAASGSYPSPALLNQAPWPGLPADTDRPLNIAPLAICVNIPLQSRGGDLPPALYDALGEEIANQPECHRQRPVNQLMWRNPFSYFGLGDLTATMHQLGTHFRLTPGAPHEYCAEIDIFQTTEEQVALLKGLGFNQLLITLPQTALASNLEDLAPVMTQRTQALRDYGFASLGIKLVYGFHDQKLHQLRHLIDTIIQLQPERIYLRDALEDYHWDPLAAACANSTEVQDHFTLLFNALRNAGYRVLGNDCFVLPKDPLAIAQRRYRLRRTLLNYNASNAADLLGLGPGAYCQLGRVYQRNEPDPQTYCRKISGGESPVVGSYSLDEQGQLLRLVIDQLLCYHRVDIAYIESRYKLHLMPLLRQAIRRLASELSEGSHALVQFQDRACMHLPPIGILHLRAICDALVMEGLLDQSNAKKFIS